MTPTVPLVLSVEDDDGIFELLQAVLYDLPIDFRRASNGRQAIAAINAQLPDLLLLDISLPDINGWDVLKAVCEQEMKPPKIIVLTAYSEPAHRLIAHFQAVDHFINKPFAPRALHRLVADILGLTATA